jgi:hypothetical protein
MALIHHIYAVTKRGGVPTVGWLELLEECEGILARAREDLGWDLGGFGKLNLLCDNTEENQDVLELVLKDLGEA